MNSSMGNQKQARRGVTAVTLGVALAMTSAGCSGSGGGSGGGHGAHAATTPVAASSYTPPAVHLPPGVISSNADVDTGPIYPIDAFGSIWVSAHRGNNLDRVDPRTNKVIAHIDAGQDLCSQAIPTDTLLIVSGCGDSTSSPVFDPKTNQMVGAIPGFVFDYAYGAGWFSNTSYTKLQRVDVATRKPLSTTPLWVGAVTHGANRLWVAEASGDNGAWHGGVAEVDPKTGQVVRTIKVADPGAYPNIVFAFGAVWLQGGGKPFFFRLDPATGKVTKFRMTGFAPESDLEGGDIVAGLGSIWMQTSPAVIGRFDPRTGKLIGRYPADPDGGGAWALPAYGSLWVSNFDSSTLWRDRLTS